MRTIDADTVRESGGLRQDYIGTDIGLPRERALMLGAVAAPRPFLRAEAAKL